MDSVGNYRAGLQMRWRPRWRPWRPSGGLAANLLWRPRWRPLGGLEPVLAAIWRPVALLDYVISNVSVAIPLQEYVLNQSIFALPQAHWSN